MGIFILCLLLFCLGYVLGTESTPPTRIDSRNRYGGYTPRSPEESYCNRCDGCNKKPKGLLKPIFTKNKKNNNCEKCIHCMNMQICRDCPLISRAPEIEPGTEI